VNNLRDIVRRHVEEETLREFLGENLQTTSIDEKQRLLEILRKRGEIDREVELILNAFQAEIEQNSPAKRKRKITTAIFSGIYLILTIAIAYAVNEKAWVFVSILAVLNIILYCYSIFYADNET
jgi:hypothetical protein